MTDAFPSPLLQAQLPRMGRATRLLLIACAVATLLIGAEAVHRLLNPFEGTFVDSFPIGEPIACVSNSRCDEDLALATSALDRRDPGHAPIVETRLFQADARMTSHRDEIDKGLLLIPPVTVVVFKLADGSTRATGVACPGVAGCAGIASYFP
ncbi:MAG TPA: hypothetical protein VFC71_11155 [Candidatus Polarisedimenticolia bacterium]|nr:hypothetical protein [Candidatus Polarisedimenticolia bacterium]